MKPKSWRTKAAAGEDSTPAKSSVVATGAALLIGALVCVPAQATTLGIDYTGSAASINTSEWNLGWSFTANQDLTVVGLGNWDGGQFPQDQQVGLWDSAGVLLASAYVSNSSDLVGNWRFTDITPVNLIAGDTYVVGAQGGAFYTGEIRANQVTVASGISYLGDRFTFVGSTENNPLVEPLATDDAPYGWFGGNLEFGTAAATPIPVPATLPLFASGLGVLGLLRWRKKRKALAA